MPNHAAGFETLDAEVSVDRLPVQGELPPWLRGSLIRTGPARFEANGRSLNHWFDGQAMLHRFSFGDGRVAYANRELATRADAAVRDGRIAFREFATDPCRSIFRRMVTMFSSGATDNANVNLTKVGERFVAMTETPLPVEFDPDTLRAMGVADSERSDGEITTAHPHVDAGRRELVNYAVKLGPSSTYRVSGRSLDGDGRRTIARLATRRPAYMHSFGLTERFVVLAEFPFRVNPLRLALGNRPFIENYRWEPEHGTRIWVIDRGDGAIQGPFETDALFAFHHVNAFERDDEIVVDLCAYDDPEIVRAFYLDRLRAADPHPPMPWPERWRIDMATKRVRRERLADHAIELPRIDYGRRNGRPYRFAYGASAVAESPFLDRLVKIDVEDGSTALWREDGTYPGEPVFVARPDGAGEDDGVALSVVLDPERGRSFLLVLDAASFAERARAEVPHHIPFGFHGQYFGSVN
ncbi:MAG TPA: carotenoid oxygenase family protein [Solirubrobacteraceae bacterium]|nr:carotenoid oxygenase family protein [Solirubrobacteraceae bacterium]